MNLQITAMDLEGNPIQLYALPRGDNTYDGVFSPLDVLNVINVINRNTGKTVDATHPEWDPAMDVDPNGVITPLDVLTIINWINNGIRPPESMPLGSISNSFRWNPSASDVGDHYLTFAASDGDLKSARIVKITVTSSVPAPVIATVSPPSAVYNNRSIAISGSNFGGGGGTLHFTGSYSAAQQNLQVGSWGDRAVSLDVSQIPGGSYNVTVETEGGRSNTKTFSFKPHIGPPGGPYWWCRYWPYYYGRKNQQMTIKGDKLSSQGAPVWVWMQQWYGSGRAYFTATVIDDKTLRITVPYWLPRYRWYQFWVRTTAGWSGDYGWLFIY